VPPDPITSELEALEDEHEVAVVQAELPELDDPASYSAPV